MWVLRQYDPDTDELVSEIELPMLRPEGAEDLLGFAPTKLGSTELAPHAVEALVRRFGVSAEDGDVESFLDFDGEPEPASHGTAPATAATR